MLSSRMDSLEKTLIEKFHLPGFRPHQREIIENILNRREVIAVLATGGGKSLCFQLPSLFVGGLAVVITPLVALMEDQVKRLAQLGIPGTFLSSLLSDDERGERLRRLARGEYTLVFVAPERLQSQAFHQALETCPPVFIVIDEAHCISQWGHDFRPSYMEIGPFIKRYNIPYKAAFTATATQETLDDIKKSLGWEKAYVVKASFDRPNLKYMAFSFKNSLQKLYTLKQLLSNMVGAGAIYCATRKDVENVYSILKMWGANPCFYHAGLSSKVRQESQAQWISGKKNLIVATNAFGMGIDKPDVRFVIHYQIPGNLENYYQEAGRAGRDRQDSYCILLYSPEDKEIQDSFLSIHRWEPEPLLLAIRENKIPSDIPDYLKRYLADISTMGITDEEKILLNLKDLSSFATLQLKKFEKMEAYVLEHQCRRKAILSYFNEQTQLKNCGGCDICLSWEPNHVIGHYLSEECTLEEEKKATIVAFETLGKKQVFFEGVFKKNPFLRKILNHSEKNGLIKEIAPAFWWVSRKNQKKLPVTTQELTLMHIPVLTIKAEKILRERGKKRYEYVSKILPAHFLMTVRRKTFQHILSEITTEDEIRMLIPFLKEVTLQRMLLILAPNRGVFPPLEKHLKNVFVKKGISSAQKIDYLDETP